MFIKFISETEEAKFEMEEEVSESLAAFALITIIKAPSLFTNIQPQPVHIASRRSRLADDHENVCHFNQLLTPM